MNFRTATLLIIGMFGSFSVIIVTMMVLFWPGSKATPRPEQRPVAPPSVSRKVRTPKKVARPTPKTSKTVPDKMASAPAQGNEQDLLDERSDGQKEPPVQPPHDQIAVAAESRPDESKPVVPPVGPRATKTIRIEQDEIRLLRIAMENRLRQQLELHERKLSQLARHCESLEPGAAAQVILNLDDDTAREILKRMDRSAALNIAALLVRLGRATAIPTHHDRK